MPSCTTCSPKLKDDIGRPSCGDGRIYVCLNVHTIVHCSSFVPRPPQNLIAALDFRSRYLKLKAAILGLGRPGDEATLQPDHTAIRIHPVAGMKAFQRHWGIRQVEHRWTAWQEGDRELKWINQLDYGSDSLRIDNLYSFNEIFAILSAECHVHRCEKRQQSPTKQLLTE